MLISRASRLKYNFSVDFFRPDGHVTFADLAAARAFAAQMSAPRTDPVPGSDLYAFFLLDEAYHIILKHYFSRYTGVMGRAMGVLQSNLGSKYDLTLGKFIEEFPPMSVFLGQTTAGVYLATKLPNFGDFGHGVRAAAVEEMLLINNSNNNPALTRYKALIDESVMAGSAYKELVQLLLDFFARQPGFGNGEFALGETLNELLTAPIKASPDSLEGQLRFIVQKWGHLLGESFSSKLLRGMDFLREETIRLQTKQIDSSQKVETYVPSFGGSEYAEYERYSPDKEWMPRLVLLAKNSYVWLSQLSKKYQREIVTLDQIPDEELDLLASRGFTGLWLIGLWERSRASQLIKQRMGQADAVASAYSLHSYDIASDLGGWNALNNLRSRAWARGIRLSADMVPNHMGIDSTWVVEHPDWFLSTPNSPYPSYSFRSENLSDDLRVGIYLEDHYYDKTDASVVFQRRDLQNGDLRYIYHGNDGTSFPWNDTAQLDYTNPVVREAVIQVILHVARNFPVIRFDAAMTLAKKHVQRLWFPEPGAGGAIPSRSQYGMTKSEFEDKVPEEFWREVVDRVAAEVPDTLLLAEAFWLMEGYFVRTLGMHRVYNSAFMHMLRDEDNAKYRLAIKNTLEFDPQILKRYVNFMNNPDEKTAVEQFGSGDKYFGICTVLSTLPGLPMFGHGQVEGFAEKYGMEYRRAKLDETADDGLIRGHEWRIFPLLHRRHLFADVEKFLLFDFYTSSGNVNEDVFAYSNRHNDERGLIVYHNRFANTSGWIKTSAAYIDKSSGRTVRKNLAEGLSLPRVGHVIFKDYSSQLEYIRSCKEIWEKGMYIELGAYQCHAFVDFRFVGDSEWQAICDQLNGAGVPSMQDKWKEMFAAKEETPVVEASVKKVRRKKKEVSLAKAKKVPAKKKAIVKKTAVKKAEPKTKKPNAKPAVKTKKAVPAKAKVVKKTKPIAKKSKKEVEAQKPTVSTKAKKPVRKKSSNSAATKKK
ncbi:alpha-amylase family glycosyl hydrolase [Candidatus Villigracilis affinis]|uniref:alpha-amylase family glycosyl hydrolase n=1 Tax=Candidatus Villigracilis affinis TaxID=3140682 RepID=UPI001D9A07FD|nr:alpha-amylase [Anaerolineales bacterium]